MTPQVVEAIFAKLVLVYGTAKFAAMYRDQDAQVVRKHWEHELRGLIDSDIAYGLAHLPPHEIPNVLQFRQLALRRPVEAFQALPAPQATPERIARSLARVEAILARLTELKKKHGDKAWAYALKERELVHGEKLHIAQRRCWREALGEEGKA